MSSTSCPNGFSRSHNFKARYDSSPYGEPYIHYNGEYATKQRDYKKVYRLDICTKCGEVRQVNENKSE